MINIVDYIKSTKHNNGIFSYSLNDEWEMMIYKLYTLCRKSGISKEEIDPLVIDKFCEKYQLDYLESFEAIKYISFKVNEE